MPHLFVDKDELSKTIFLESRLLKQKSKENIVSKIAVSYLLEESYPFSNTFPAIFAEWINMYTYKLPFVKANCYATWRCWLLVTVNLNLIMKDNSYNFIGRDDGASVCLPNCRNKVSTWCYVQAHPFWPVGRISAGCHVPIFEQCSMPLLMKRGSKAPDTNAISRYDITSASPSAGFSSKETSIRI